METAADEAVNGDEEEEEEEQREEEGEDDDDFDEPVLTIFNDVEAKDDICGGPRRVLRGRCSCLFTCFSKFRTLRQSPRDLVIIYLITFVDSLAYFSFSYALILHLGHDVGLSDEMAGIFYGLFGLSISIATLIMGFVVDRIRIKKSIMIAATLGLVARMGMAYVVLTGSSALTGIFLFGPVSMSVAIMTPAIPIAVKRYTTASTINFAFSIYYGVMNVAAVIASPVIDALRLGMSGKAMGLPPYAFLVALTAFLHVPSLILAWVWLRDVDLKENGVIGDPPPAPKNLFRMVKTMLRTRDFWKAIVLGLSLIGVKSSFRYFDALYLPYILRSFPDSGSFPYMSLLVINPVIVITMTATAAITVITRLMHPVNAMILGSLIGGLASFWMAFGPFMYSLILYIIFVSFGEVIWSPVLYSYLALLADTGQEGAWLAMANIPLFAAKMLTGGLGGKLLGTFCPDPALTNSTIPEPSIGGTDQCNAAAIWGIIGATTMTSFFILLAVRKFVSVTVDPETGNVLRSSMEEQLMVIPLDDEADDWMEMEREDDLQGGYSPPKAPVEGTFVICGDSDEEEEEEKDVGLPMDETVFMALAKMYAYHRSREKGKNGDRWKNIAATVDERQFKAKMKSWSPQWRAIVKQDHEERHREIMRSSRERKVDDF